MMRSNESPASSDPSAKGQELERLRLDDGDFIMSLARGLVVLRAFSRKWKHLSMAQISHVTGIPRASVGRCLHTLLKLGYVGVDEEQRYFLLPKVMQLSDAYTSSNRLLTLAQPLLDHLAEEFGEACSLALIDGYDTVYVARGLSSRIMSLKLNVGGRSPLYCSAVGLVTLAFYDEKSLDAYLKNVEFVRYTKATITDPSHLREILAGIREQGYAISSQHRDVNLVALAVPLHDRDNVIFGGVNVIVRYGSMPTDQIAERFVVGLRKAATKLEKLFNENRPA